MSYGLEIVNDSSQTIIDSTYRNYQLAESGSSVSCSNNNTSTGYYNSINFATSVSSPPVVLFQPGTDYYSGVSSYNKSGSDFTGFNVSVQRNTSGGTYTTAINWKSAILLPSASSDEYGLRVYDASSNIVFDSGKSNFHIYSVHDVSVSMISGVTTITHSGISNPYYILSPTGFGTLWVSRPLPARGGQGWGRCLMKKIDDTSVSIGYLPIYQAVIPGGQGSGNYTAVSSFKLIVCNILA